MAPKAHVNYDSKAWLMTVCKRSDLLFIAQWFQGVKNLARNTISVFGANSFVLHGDNYI